MALKSFPRGGKKPQIQVKQKKKRQTKKVELGKPKKLDLTPKTTAPLTTSTLCEGMLIFGCVSQCNEYEVTVSLPGRLRGKVQAVDVSEAYTNILQDLIKSPETHSAEYKTLSVLYKCGDYVVAYVKRIETDPKYRVILSFEPQLINQNLDPAKLQKGSKIACTISSVEDHGYVVETGIKTLRGFLSHKNVDDRSQLYPGKQIFCSITNVKSVDNTVTVELTTKSKHTQSSSANTNFQSLDSLTPGTYFNLRIKKILSNGLQVTFNEDNLGYINQIYLLHSLESYTEGTEILGVFQYVVPTVKLAYFSELLPNKERESSVTINEIITNAKVLFRTSNGFVLRLKKGVRGFVAFSHIGVTFDDISTKFLRKSAHRCRVMAYDIFDQLYIVTMLPERLKDDFSVAECVEIGDILSVTITQITVSGFVLVQCGKILGCIAPTDLTDTKIIKIGDTLKARVIARNKMDNGWIFTTKKELVNSELPVLADINEASVGAKYHATIIIQKDNGLLVSFFNNVKGWISEKTLTAASESPHDYTVGQIVVVKIDKIIKEANKVYASIVSNAIDWNFEIGQCVEGTVVDASTDGIYLKISNDNGTAEKIGFLPSGHMAPCPNLGQCLAINFHPGEKLSAMIFSTSPEFLLTRTFVPSKKFTSLRTLELGDCIPCSFKEIDSNQAHVILPTSDLTSHGIIPLKKIDSPDFLSPYQLLFGRIYSLNKAASQILLSMSASEVRFKSRANEHPMIAVMDALTVYLGKIKELSTFYSDDPLGSMYLGQCLKGTVNNVTKNGLVLLLENESTAIVRTAHYKDEIKAGQSVTGVVLWLDYETELVEMSLLPNLIHSFSPKQCKLPVDTLLTGEIVYVSPWIILAALKGSKKRSIVALPAKSHVNDLNPDLSTYQIGKRIRCYVVLNKGETEILPICILKSTLASKSRIETSQEVKKKAVNNDLLLRRLCLKSSTPKKTKKKPVKELKDLKKLGEEKNIKKRKKVEQPEETTEVVVKKIKQEVPIQQNIEQDSTIVQEVTTTVSSTNSLNVGIPECGFFWDTNADESLKIKDEPSSASEDEPEEEEPKAKKMKKLSAAERRDLEKQKERELCDREAVLASNQAPKSADQYDRLVLASPDSSLIWIQYMAFHLQAAEIDKARAVANRALKTINYREETEKLNVWKASLNLESRFGSPETLKSVFQEALVVNDPLSVQLHMLTIHADAKRQSELEKTVRVITGKFKQVPQAWVECGEALLKIGLKDQSIFTMQRATQSLPSKEHVNILARFAHLHAQYNDMDTALTLFEQILSSYPARVDIWSAYVDIYVKNGDYDGARKVLQKAVVQTLPPRKMKTFFKKYLTFEEQHGTPEGVAHVRQLTKDYVEKKCNNPGN